MCYFNKIIHYFSKFYSTGKIRRKLEKIVGKNSELPKHLYLEFHIKYELENSRLDDFVNRVLKNGGHTSSNMLKLSENPNLVFHFATTRTLENYRKLLYALSDFHRINTIRECVVFDDNPEIDTGWCGCECGLKQIESECDYKTNV